MNSVFQIRDNCMTIRVPEELDHHNALPIQQEADEVMMNRNIQTIIFDFRDTSFMDSSGIGVLMGRYRAIQRKGGRIQAENVNERIEKILIMSGITKLIPVNSKKVWMLAGGHLASLNGCQMRRRIFRVKKGDYLWKTPMKCFWNLIADP